MPESLNIAGLGMVSSLGIGSELNAAATRCNYDGFLKVDSNSIEDENLLISKTELSDEYRGNKRLAKLMQIAIDEAIENLPSDVCVPLYVCLPERDSILNNNDKISKYLREELKKTDYSDLIDYSQSIHFSKGRVSFVHACQKAQQLLNNETHDFILVIAIDSLLSPQLINYYQGQLRLLQTGNSDAFIPGEASVAVLLTKQNIANTTEILGLSTAEESGTILNDQSCTGSGLTQAVNQAAEQSGISISNTDFRMSTASGEHYFFKELTIVHSRVMNKTKETHPLWHPADNIGEVGAVSALAMLVMAHYAFQKGYAPGKTAICHVSNDNEQRAAFILRHKESI